MKKIIIVLILVAGVIFQAYGEVDIDKSSASMAVDRSEEMPMHKSNMTPKPRAVELEEDVVYEEPRGVVGRTVDATEDVAVAAGDTLEAAAEVPGRVLGVL